MTLVIKLQRQADCAGLTGIYAVGREPAMRICTSLLALSGQSGTDETLETPTSARSKSSGSRSGGYRRFQLRALPGNESLP